MANYIVTTPKSMMLEAAIEARDLIDAGGGKYYRKVPYMPSDIGIKGCLLFYVEDGYVRGFAEIISLEIDTNFTSDTGTDWGRGNFIVLDATTWKWIKPIKMRGFRGIRRFIHDYEVIGNWKDLRPAV